MGELWRLLNAPCRDIATLVSAGMDTDLSFNQRVAVRLHLLYCRACRAYRRQVHLLRRLLQLASAAEVEEGGEAAGGPTRVDPELLLSPEARQRMQRAINAAYPPQNPT